MTKLYENKSQPGASEHSATSGAQIDLDRLEALARAATPGPWMRLFGERTVYDRMEDGCRGNAIVRADLGYSQNDAMNLDFIAAANPAAVLDLIALARASLPAGESGEAVATVVSRAGDDLRIGWLRPELCEVGANLYLAAPSVPAQSGASDEDLQTHFLSVQDQCEHYRKEAADLRAQLASVQKDAERPAWQRVTAPGQVSVGDKLRFTIGDVQFNERVKQILNPGQPDEELIYNKRRNFYVITSNAITNFGSSKNVEFQAARAQLQQKG